ncbi:hypothetical protein E2C01_043843 [Portunus trituberculatus]|uniref:Uncharacterized protein n=1 Tax=Portunus trituberculatus TaxID=210409 RepID=A0A5B7G0L6_PORTR|nr:hypothetical protein [Portunus trituberculatus]
MKTFHEKYIDQNTTLAGPVVQQHFAHSTLSSMVESPRLTGSPAKAFTCVHCDMLTQDKSVIYSDTVTQHHGHSATPQRPPSSISCSTHQVLSRNNITKSWREGGGGASCGAAWRGTLDAPKTLPAEADWYNRKTDVLVAVHRHAVNLPESSADPLVDRQVCVGQPVR